MKEHSKEFMEMLAAADGDDDAIRRADARVLADKLGITVEAALKIIEENKNDNGGSFDDFHKDATPKLDHLRKWELEQDETNTKLYGENGLRPEHGPDNQERENKS